MRAHRRRRQPCDHFWFGPGEGIAGILMTHLLPFLDPDFISRLAEILQPIGVTAGNQLRTASTLEGIDVNGSSPN
jgi:hypothetical protein